MSGGSFNHLCFAEVDDLVSGKFDVELERMAEYLAEYSQDGAIPAKETFALLLGLRAYRAKMQAYIKRLTGVWHEAEWVASGDSNPEVLYKAIQQYLGRTFDER